MGERTTEELVHSLELACEEGADDRVKAALIQLVTVNMDDLANRILGLMKWAG